MPAGQPTRLGAGCFCPSLIYLSHLLHCYVCRAFAWDGLEGSLAKFGCSVGFERFANVPYSEGTVCAGFESF